MTSLLFRPYGNFESGKLQVFRFIFQGTIMNVCDGSGASKKLVSFVKKTENPLNSLPTTEEPNQLKQCLCIF